MSNILRSMLLLRMLKYSQGIYMSIIISTCLHSRGYQLNIVVVKYINHQKIEMIDWLLKSLLKRVEYE